MSGETLNRPPRIHNERIRSLFDFAKTTEVVRNNLLRPELVAYYLYWKDKLNPDSREFSTLYTGMGADPATPLLMQNATMIHHADHNRMKTSRFKDAFEHWNDLEQYITTQRRVDMVGTRGYVPYADIATAMKFYCNRGYDMQSYALDSWPAELLLALRLKLLGVQRDSIRSPQSTDDSLDFSWAFPGEEAKQRRMWFHFCDMANLRDDVFDIPPVDCVMQKAHMDQGIINRPATLEYVTRRLLQSHGFLLVTPSPTSKQPDEARKNYAALHRQLAGDYDEIKIPLSVTKLMAIPDNPPNLQYSDPYGWHFVGAQKRV